VCVCDNETSRTLNLDLLNVNHVIHAPGVSHRVSTCPLTCALLDSRAFLQRVAAQLALEVVFPELGEPNVPPVVLQRSAGEVAIEAWADSGAQRRDADTQMDQRRHQLSSGKDFTFSFTSSAVDRFLASALATAFSGEIDLFVK